MKQPAESSAVQPDTIQKLGSSAYPAFAMIAGMQLEVFTPLGSGPMSAEDLAEALAVKSEKLTPLLFALVAAGLLTFEHGTFLNTPESNHFLVKGKPGYLGGRHAFYTARYNELLQTAASIRTGCPQAKHDFASMSADALEKFLRGLHPNTMVDGRNLADRFNFQTCRHLLDVGGGSGGMALAIAAACPQLRATVLEFPSVVPVTQRFIEEEGMAERVDVLACDVVKAPVGGKYDVAILRAFIQVLSPRDAPRALCHISSALESGGSIYIIGRVLDDSRVSPAETVAFNLIFLNMYDEGQAYTESEYRDWLSEAGFCGIDRIPLSSGNSIITARKT